MYTAETEFFKVSVDDSARIATLCWRREVKLHEFQQGCLVLGALFRNYNINRGLINLNKRGTIPVEAAEWLETLKDNPVLKANVLQIAMVMSEERYQDLIYDYSLTQAQPYKLPILFHYFTNEEEAMDWLLHQPAEIA